MNETVFWRPSPDDRNKIARTGRVQDVEDGLSEFPHLIVNQAACSRCCSTTCASRRRAWNATMAWSSTR
ncbi:hypothetical protein [Thauera humireducens]|uniref:hypothetical protein n=1 Tax=Thauera humireducens TaxID=1134435 RepID=UPI00311F6122